jgi:hypothetical protein
MKFLYQFNKLGNLIDIHLNLNEASIKTNINKSSLNTAIYNKQLVLQAFYFSYDKNFKKPEFRKETYEPLFDEWRIFGEKRNIHPYKWQPWKTNNII